MKIKSLIVVMLLFSGLFVGVVPENVTAFSKDVYNFDKIWYHPTEGFNKNEQGSLIMAVTYTNNSFRNIDYASFTYTNEPFYLRIAFSDELTIERDVDGNIIIIYEEPKDGYIYLNKAITDNHMPENIKKLASKGFTYKTITYDGDQWYRISVPNFNRVYEWKEFIEPSVDGKWHTWGNSESIQFETKPMFIELISESSGGLIFDFDRPGDNSGQQVSISKSYLSSIGITNPYFEWGTKKLWNVLPHSENETHYFINPEHFSWIGIHEVVSGITNGTIIAEDVYAQDAFYEGYNTGDTTSWKIGGLEWSAQSFTVGTVTDDRDYYVTSVRLYVERENTPGVGTVSIHAVDGANKPVSANLTYSVYDFDTLPTTDPIWVEFKFVTHPILSASTQYAVVVSAPDGNVGLNKYVMWLVDYLDPLYTGGCGIGSHDSGTTWQLYVTYYDLMFEVYSSPEKYVVTRTTGVATEKINLTFNPLHNWAENVTLKVPVSTSVQAILDVTNNTNDIEATEVNTSDDLINNTYWYDSGNQFVHIRTVNYTEGSLIVNWTINCSYGATFAIEPPSYLRVGDYFQCVGLIKDADGDAISGYTATTRITFENGVDAITPVEYNCTNGNYFITIATNALTPGSYLWEISFIDIVSGVTFKRGGTLDLSVGSGGYYGAMGYFNFYDNSEGIGAHSPSFTFYDPGTGTGIDSVFLKLYVSEDTSFDEEDRVFQQQFETYTGQVLYYKVLDYFDNKIYPPVTDYATVTIIYVNQYIDIPIEMYTFSVKNMNHSIVKFEIHNDTRAYIQYLFPYEPFYWHVFPGDYEIFMFYYDTETDSHITTGYDNITIDNHTYYWIRGYDLQDIIIEVQFTNTIVGNLEISIRTNIDIVNSTVNNITTNIQTSLSLTESNLTAINNLIWNAINITDSVVDYLNNTMWTEFNAINLTVDNINNNIWTNFTFLESEINNLSISISTNLEVSETNITNLIIDVWNSLNISNSTINELNATIWNNLTFLQNTMGDVNLSIRNVVFLVENNISSLIITISNIIDYALMPDIEIVVFNPPMVFSVYDKEGMAIGGNIYKICPALTVIATTKIETYGNWINSTARVPGNDTVENGTITILKDSLYISGSGAINWINITYTDNGTLMQNTTYIPSKINLYGQNLTINASGDIHILRETKYNQVIKFDWTHYADTGRHITGISVINPMNVPIYDVYVYVEFSNQSTPDPNTVVVRDISNDGVVLKSGENYDIGLISVHFYLLSIDSDSTRGFTFEYYKRFDDAYRYGEETVSVSGYIETVWNGLSFNKCIISYINNENTIFRGGLYASLNFDVPTEIDGNSIRIWDENNNHELNDSCFIFGNGFVRIDASGLGDVAPGGGRRFSMYFLLREYPGADPTELHLNTPIWMGITPFLIIFIIGAIIISYGVYAYIFKKEKDWWKGIVLGVFIIFIFYILAFAGV